MLSKPDQIWISVNHHLYRRCSAYHIQSPWNPNRNHVLDVWPQSGPFLWCCVTPLLHDAALHHCYMMLRYTTVTWCCVTPLLHDATLHHCYMMLPYTTVTWCCVTPLLHDAALHHCYMMLPYTTVTWCCVTPLLHDAALHHCYMMLRYTTVTWCCVTPLLHRSQRNIVSMFLVVGARHDVYVSQLQFNVPPPCTAKVGLILCRRLHSSAYTYT